MEPSKQMYSEAGVEKHMKKYLLKKKTTWSIIKRFKVKIFGLQKIKPWKQCNICRSENYSTKIIIYSKLFLIVSIYNNVLYNAWHIQFF